jgi:hypothetical protein
LAGHRSPTAGATGVEPGWLSWANLFWRFAIPDTAPHPGITRFAGPERDSLRRAMDPTTRKPTLLLKLSGMFLLR